MAPTAEPTKTPQNPWVWGALLLGVFFIGLSNYLFKKQSTALSPVETLARAERMTGAAFLLRGAHVSKEKIDRKASVGHLDSVETGDLGEVRLDFESAYRVRVKEHSLITLERVEDQNGFHVVLIVKRGSVQIENYGREGDLFIAKNGERISAADYHTSALSNAPVEEAEPAEAPETSIPESTSLSEKEIQDVMSSHRTSFLKCYTQLLQKDPNSKGEVTLTFTVENSGKMSAVEVTSASLNQDDFKKCLVDVMSRVEFRPFKGSPVSTLFPLKFE